MRSRPSPTKDPQLVPANGAVGAPIEFLYPTPLDVDAHGLSDDVVCELSSRPCSLAREREARAALLAQESLQWFEGVAQGRRRSTRPALALRVEAPASRAADSPFFPRSPSVSGRLPDNYYEQGQRPVRCCSRGLEIPGQRTVSGYLSGKRPDKGAARGENAVSAARVARAWTPNATARPRL